MHTSETNNGTVFIHNSDMSGDVEIINSEGRRVKVDGNDILQFVAGYIRGVRVSKLEQLTTNEILEGKL